MKIKKGTTYFNEANGAYYRVNGRHFDDFDCERSDGPVIDDDALCTDMTPESEWTWTSCILTIGEVRKLVGANVTEWITFDDED